QLHKALGLNPYPAVYYGDRASPGGMREIQRQAHALVDRAEALLSVVRANIRGPAGSRLADEVTSLVQASDAFHDGIHLDARPDAPTRNGFAGVPGASDLLPNAPLDPPVSDRVRAAWRSFRTVEPLMRQTLKPPARQSDQGPSAVPVEGRTPV